MIAPSRMRSSNLRYYERDYHAEVPGHWLGSGPAAKGLSGIAASKDSRKVFSGFAPDGTKLVQNAGRATGSKKGRIGHRPGVEVAANPPKSVSILDAILGDGPRARIRAAEFATVDTCFRMLERHIGWCRVGQGGKFLQHADLIGVL